MQPETRRRAYFAIMGACLVLIGLAWFVVRLWSTGLAVSMSLIAAVLPPVAAIVGNLGSLDRSAPPTFPSDHPENGPQGR